MKRIITKIGDIFSVKIDNNIKKYFQLIAFDLTQLNSDVIRAFKREYAINSQDNIADIVNGEIDFYAHCVTKFGIKMDLWEKVGKSQNLGNLHNILFRDTNDAGNNRPGEEPIMKSDKWYVWRINEPFIKVGKLVGENRNAEIGVVVNPYDIVERMKTGKYKFLYPDID